jgi:hypothetical protein
MGHSRRYYQVRLVVRYRQYPTLGDREFGTQISTRLGRQDRSGRRPHALLAMQIASWVGKACSWACSSPHQAQKRRVLAFSVLYRSGAPVPRPLIGMPRSAGECCRRPPTPSCCSAGGIFPQSCRRATTCIRFFETRISILVSRSPLLVSSVKTSAS